MTGKKASTAEVADDAIKLLTAITIGGVSFDGSESINLKGVNIAGDQDTSGNAATATKLATARKIGGVDFDGTAPINLPGVNTTGNQNTSGNAATASDIASGKRGTIAVRYAKAGESVNVNATGSSPNLVYWRMRGVVFNQTTSGISVKYLYTNGPDGNDFTVPSGTFMFYAYESYIP